MLGPGIAKRVASLAASKRLTQQEIAEASKLSQSTISKLMSGKTVDPRVSILLGVARAFGCSLDLLLGVTPMPAPPPTHDELLVRLVRLEAVLVKYLRGEAEAVEAQIRAIEAEHGAALRATSGNGRRRRRRVV